MSARKDLDLPPTGELSRDDQARLDRLALQRALCALDYLEMHRADRVKKAKRLSRTELAKRAAEDSGKPPSIEVAVASGVESPQAADEPSNEAPAENLTTVEPPAEAPVTKQVAESVDTLLATAESNNGPPHKTAPARSKKTRDCN